MIIKDFLPGLHVREYVRWYRIVDFKFGKDIPLPVKAYPPKPEHILHFFLRDRFAIQQSNGELDFQPRISFVGQRTHLFRQVNESDFLNFQIVFHPTALFRLTGMPATDFTNHFTAGEEVFSKQIELTKERLQLASSYEQLLRIGEDFVKQLILKKRKDTHGIDAVVDAIMRGHHTSIGKYSHEIDLSSKQFARVFQQRTGVNPRMFLRIARFNKAYNIRNRYPHLDWLQIAVDCGYHDYQHLVRDYKQFTGYTPTEFHHLEKRSPECLLGLAQDLYESRCR